MGTTIATRAGRRLGQMAAVALVALLLAGLAAAPAGAKTRDDGRQEANDFIAWCVGEGGDPVVIVASEDRITVACNDLPGGDFLCNFYPDPYCKLWGARVTPGDLPKVEIVQDGAPAKRPGLADPAKVGRTILIEDGATEAPLRSSRITVLSGSAVVPADDVVDGQITLSDITTGPAIAPVLVPPAEEIPVPTLEEDGVVTTQLVPAPVAEEITVPEIEEDAVGTIPPAPPADEQP